MGSRPSQQGYGWSLGDKHDWPRPLVGIRTLPERTEISASNFFFFFGGGGGGGGGGRLCLNNLPSS